MKQQGFILPSAGTLYAAIGAAVIILGLGVALKVQTSRLEAKTAQYDGFVAQVKAQGDMQNLRTKETEARHIQIVKEKDNANLIARANFNNAAQRLRDNNSRRGLLPPSAPGTSSPDKACFDRTELNGALREFTREVDELIIEGESSAIDLNTAKQWNQEITK